MTMHGWALACEFTVPGVPVPWSRVRGNGANRFNTPEHKAFKRQVALAAWAAGARAPKAIEKGRPVRLTVEVHLPLPSKWSKVDADLWYHGVLYPTGKPDLDNWIKLPMDALNGLVWQDDAQVVAFGPSTGKFYSTKPRLYVAVEVIA